MVINGSDNDPVCAAMHCRQVPTAPMPSKPTVYWNRNTTIAAGNQLPKSMQPCCTRERTLSDRERNMITLASNAVMVWLNISEGLKKDKEEEEEGSRSIKRRRQ